MYTRQALRELGVGPNAITSAQMRQMDELGFFIVENVLDETDLAAMRAEFERIHGEEKDRGGHEVHVEPGARRISNIFNKTSAFDKCLEIAPILAASHYLLGEMKLHGANLRDPVKGYGQQDLHVDVPKKFADDWWVANSMIMLDDMTLTNGPTRVVPGSQWWAPINVPHVNIGDWEPAPLSLEDQARVPKDLGAPYPGEVKVTAPAGSAIICNSSMWHSGHQETGRHPPPHAAFDLHPPRPAAATGAARSPDARTLPTHEPRPPLPHGNRTAKGRRRRTAASEEGGEGVVELKG
ncbi:MAG: phytanoyl-CoA dioxygenase family protein [Rhizobiales bacterium]|nr:phytanoyl-CoA dioxygenase family protein [Hyphomicrobiales bacterium]